MMRRILFTLLMSTLLSQVSAQWDSTLVVGSQSSFSQIIDSLNEYPIPFGKEGALSIRQQYAYTDYELGIPFPKYRVKSISFFVDSVRDTVIDDFAIAFTASSDSILTSFQITRLFRTYYQQLRLKKGWNKLVIDTFQNPILYSGSNLIIDVCWTDSSRIQNTIAYHSTSQNSSISYEDTNYAACGTQFLSFRIRTNRPDIKITLTNADKTIGWNEPHQNTTPWKAFPNPVNHILNIQGSSAGEYQVFNIAGQMMQEGYIQSNLQTLDVSGLQQGVYLLKISHPETDTLDEVVRFVKQ